MRKNKYNESEIIKTFKGIAKENLFGKSEEVRVPIKLVNEIRRYGSGKY